MFPTCEGGLELSPVGPQGAIRVRLRHFDLWCSRFPFRPLSSRRADTTHPVVHDRPVARAVAAPADRELEVPGRELLDAVLVLLAGVVLITPGILTDAVGFTLMTGPGRNWVARRIRKRLEASIESVQVGGDTRPEEPTGGRIIEL